MKHLFFWILFIPIPFLFCTNQAEHRTTGSFVLAKIIHNHPVGQVCFYSTLITINDIESKIYLKQYQNIKQYQNYFSCDIVVSFSLCVFYDYIMLKTITLFCCKNPVEIKI